MERKRVEAIFNTSRIPCAGPKGRAKRPCGNAPTGCFFCPIHQQYSQYLPKSKELLWKIRMVGTPNADRKRVQLALYKSIVEAKEARERREANRIAEQARAIRRQMHEEAVREFLAEEAEMAKADQQEAFSDEDGLAEFELEVEEQEEQRQQQEQQMQH